jgi:hypothetical protein
MWPQRIITRLASLSAVVATVLAHGRVRSDETRRGCERSPTLVPHPGRLVHEVDGTRYRYDPAPAVSLLADSAGTSHAPSCTWVKGRRREYVLVDAATVPTNIGHRSSAEVVAEPLRRERSVVEAPVGFRPKEQLNRPPAGRYGFPVAPLNGRIDDLVCRSSRSANHRCAERHAGPRNCDSQRNTTGDSEQARYAPRISAINGLRLPA